MVTFARRYLLTGLIPGLQKYAKKKEGDRDAELAALNELVANIDRELASRPELRTLPTPAQLQGKTRAELEAEKRRAEYAIDKFSRQRSVSQIETSMKGVKLAGWRNFISIAVISAALGCCRFCCGSFAVWDGLLGLVLGVPLWCSFMRLLLYCQAGGLRPDHCHYYKFPTLLWGLLSDRLSWRVSSG